LTGWKPVDTSIHGQPQSRWYIETLLNLPGIKTLRIARASIVFFTLLVTLAACSWLPRSGPKTSDMLAAGDAAHGVTVVELDPATVGVLSASEAPSLLGAFGDYRPPREQRIGVGDAVQITLWEAGPGGLFSSPVVDRSSAGSRSAVIPEQVVAQDGSITVPFAGRIMVIGRTPPEVESVIVQRLADKAIDPQALVTVTRNISNTATVMGEVNPGARVPLTVRGDRLLDVIAVAGGIRAPIADISIVLSRGDRIVRVPMAAVLNDPRENIYLRPGDVVTLVRNPQSFTAVGATGRSGIVDFDVSTLTLDQALAKAGGLLDDRADPEGVFVIRLETPQVTGELPQMHVANPQPEGIPVIYHLNMRNADSFLLAHKFPVRNKDIVYVSDSPITDVQKVFGLVNLLVTPVVTGATIKASTQ
jgi:polysaccharide export outer membrane protein